MQLVYYSNDLQRAKESLLNAITSEDKKIRSKYNMLKSEGYELKGVSVYDSYTLDPKKNPTQLTYDVYRFENEDEEQRELIVTQNLKLYKGSLAALERSAIYQESSLYNSDEYKEFKSFGKFLDCLNKSSEMSYLYGTSYDLKDKLFHSNAKEIMGCLERITWDSKESDIKWLDASEKRYKVEAYGIRNCFITEARKQYEEVLKDIDKLREVVSDNSFPCMTTDGKETKNKAFLKVLSVLDAALYHYETNKYANRTFELIINNGNAKDIKDILTMSIDSQDGNAPYHKEFDDAICDYIFNQLKENPETLHSADFSRNINNFAKWYKPSRDEKISEMFYDGEVMLTLKSPKYKLNGHILSEKDIIKELYRQNSRLLSDFVNSNNKQEFIEKHSNEFFGIFDREAGKLMRRYNACANPNQEIFRANILNNIYYNPKVTVPSYNEEELSLMPSEFKNALNEINQISEEQKLIDLHRKYNLEKQQDMDVDISISVEQIQEFMTSQTVTTQVLEEHANGWKELRPGASFVGAAGQSTSQATLPDQDDESLEKEILEEYGIEQEDDEPEQEEDELEPTMWPRRFNLE